MVELLLETRKLEHRLCEHCDRTFRARLHVPTLGANNAILRNRYLLAAADNMPVLERSRASTQQCLAELEREIEGLQKALQWSLGARAEVKHLLDVQDAYFAPVRKLPIEILSEIFILCCGKSTNLTGERCAPLDLSAVCKVWRGMSDCQDFVAVFADNVRSLIRYHARYPRNMVQLQAVQ